MATKTPVLACHLPGVPVLYHVLLLPTASWILADQTLCGFVLGEEGGQAHGTLETNLFSEGPNPNPYPLPVCLKFPRQLEYQTLVSREQNQPRGCTSQRTEVNRSLTIRLARSVRGNGDVGGPLTSYCDSGMKS